ncbi:50S ribosomal protein L25/general stress protein Ctc [Halomonas halocynthiae]|uniref:50S ribosomal protein L25/general stress protein Ctc n=1 Tax=Halomonas halocynthiae TaxID=176290 RepID=UPI000428B439|nr:50S ribosomal protein L25/general stress protein Ctc [Halomonas halocynthiae]
MSNFILNASIRNDLGKGASRRLRRENKEVPAIVYGGDKAPQAITLEKTGFYKAIEDEAFFSSVIDLEVDGKKYPVVVRDLQRHPFKPLVSHVDFMRIDAKQEITMHVPLHVANEETCKGIKDEDGELHLLANDVEISCLPKDLPDYLEVDIAELSVGAVLHLSDLKLPAGVTIVALAREEVHDNAILSISQAKVRDEEDDADAGESAAEEGKEGDAE